MEEDLDIQDNVLAHILGIVLDGEKVPDLVEVYTVQIGYQEEEDILAHTLAQSGVGNQVEHQEWDLQILDEHQVEDKIHMVEGKVAQDIEMVDNLLEILVDTEMEDNLGDDKLDCCLQEILELIQVDKDQVVLVEEAGYLVECEMQGEVFQYKLGMQEEQELKMVQLIQQGWEMQTVEMVVMIELVVGIVVKVETEEQVNVVEEELIAEMVVALMVAVDVEQKELVEKTGDCQNTGMSEELKKQLELMVLVKEQKNEL